MPARVPSLLAIAALAALALSGIVHAGEPAGALVRELAPGRVDWSACEVQATAGAAADPRMPSPSLARPAAERRARAAALAGLKSTLQKLPLGAGRKPAAADIERALGRAVVGRVEYQSNGGAVVTMTVRFQDLQAAASPDGGAVEPVAALSVPSTAFEAAPQVKVDGREVAVGSACYRQGTPPAAIHAVAAQRDPSGRLVVKGEAGLADRLAGGPILIYFQKLAR